MDKFQRIQIQLNVLLQLFQMIHLVYVLIQF